MAHKCPGCGETYPTERGRTSHAAQNDDSQHPWKTYAEVREAVESGDENRTTAAGSKSDPPQNGGGSGGSRDEQIDPSLAAPEWGAERDDVCTSCGGRMDRLAENQQVTVERGDGVTVTGRADGSERLCRNCELVHDGGDTYTYVN